MRAPRAPFTRTTRRRALAAGAGALALARPGLVRAQSRSGLRWAVKQLSERPTQATTPAIVADTTGVAHMVWAQTADKLLPASLFYARTDGMRWLVNDVIAEEGRTPRLALDATGTLHLTWATATGVRYCAAHVDEASLPIGWSLPRTIAYGPTSGSVFDPVVACDASGAVHVLYATVSADQSAVYYLRSDDAGLHWSLPQEFFRRPNETSAVSLPQLVMSDDGTLHAAWSLIPTSNYYGGLGVYYARSEDGGATWPEPNRLRGPNEGAWQASLAARTSNEIHVVWDAHAESGRRHHQWSRDGGRTWSSPAPVWPQFISQTGVNPMAVDAGGSLYLITGGGFDWDHPQALFASRWLGNGWEPPQPIDTSSETPHYPQAVVTNGDTLHVVWQAGRENDTQVWYASSRTFAPHVAPRPYPALSRPSTGGGVRPVETPLPAKSPTPDLAPGAGLGSLAPAVEHPGVSVLAGALPVAAIVGAVLAARAIGRAGG